MMLLLRLVGVAALAAAASADPCQFDIGPLGAQPIARMFECFDTIPFDAAVAANTGESLSKAMQIYVFADIANDPPKESAGLAVRPVHLFDDIATITKAGGYANDYEFQSNLTALFRLLGDAHTRYILPANYRMFKAGLPVNLMAYSVDGKQEVRVSPTPLDGGTVAIVSQFMPRAAELPAVANATVVTIAGEPALDFLVRFANDSVGLSKDLGTRLNTAASSFEPSPTTVGEAPAEISGVYTHRGGDFSPFPDRGEDSVEMVFLLANGTAVKLDLPWLAVVPSSSLDSDSFRNAWYATDGASTAAAAADATAPIPDYVPETHPLWSFEEGRRTPAAAAAAAVPSPVESLWRDGEVPLPRRDPETGACTGSLDCFELLVESPSVRFYRIVGDDRTVVLYWNTFAPANGDTFQTAVATGLAKAAALGLDRLLIDSTGNGGGDICLGRLMLSYLVDPHHNYGPTEMPRSALADAMSIAAETVDVDGGIWEAGSYTADNGTAFPPNSAAWLLDGTSHTRGGKTRAYSQLLHLSDDACSYDTPVPAQTKNVSEIVILTHGLCGSTCALFVDHAALYDHVRTVVVGGVAGRDMQYTSFPGLQVYDTPGLWDEMESYFPGGDPRGYLPPRLTTSARYRMCGRQIYPHAGAPAPTEYTFLRADHRIESTYANTVHPEFAWFDAVKLFSN